MKIFLICATLFLGIINSTYGNSYSAEKQKNWFIDSYNYGKEGNDCSDIYYNYGIKKWTFSSENSKQLKKLYEACKIGEKDKLTGQSRLPEVLRSLGDNE